MYENNNLDELARKVEQQALNETGNALQAPAQKPETEVEESLVIKFNKPYLFEGRTYDGIDLSGMEEMTAADMIAVSKLVSRSSGVDVIPEVSLEYACHFAARAANQPVEFFLYLPPREVMKVKNRVMGFLFGSD